MVDVSFIEDKNYLHVPGRVTRSANKVLFNIYSMKKSLTIVLTFKDSI